MKPCVFCGAQIEDDAVFCSRCGEKQAAVYTQTFRRNGLSEEAFIAKINAWFEAYPQVANVTGKFTLGEELGMLVNHYVLNALTIRYEQSDRPCRKQYAVVHLEHFGLAKRDADILLKEWLSHNPGAQVVKADGGIHQRGDSGSLAFNGLGASNKTQVYVLFCFDRV